jgi:hypothetical protein
MSAFSIHYRRSSYGFLYNARKLLSCESNPKGRLWIEMLKTGRSQLTACSGHGMKSGERCLIEDLPRREFDNCMCGNAVENGKVFPQTQKTLGTSASPVSVAATDSLVRF